jgi:hypothetical protein
MTKTNTRTNARTLSPADTISEIYAIGDGNWVSDYQGRKRFAALVATRLDEAMKALLRELSDIDRWIVERHTGVWHGETRPRDWQTIADELEIAPDEVAEHFHLAIADLRQRGW